jgi:hypothetical protein
VIYAFDSNALDQFGVKDGQFIQKTVERVESYFNLIAILIVG